MMKLLLLSCLLAFASASPLLECSYGPSYWCKSIATAKKCGAVDHCISTIWAHQRVVKSDNDAVCDFCQGVISQVKTLLLSNETEGEIHSYFTKACSLIPEKFLRDKCNEVVDHYEAEIIKMIKAHLDPVAVCEAMGICKSGFSDTVHHPDKLVAKKRIPMKLGNATVCADCTKFFGDVKAMITSNSTKQQIISLIEQNVCSQLGNLEPECKQLVENYADAVVQLISSEVDPSKICQAMGFCGGDRSILIAMKLAKTKLYKAAQKVSDSAVCDICKEAMGIAQNLVRANKTQEDVEEFLDKELCERLGSLAASCKDGVKQFGPVLFELLANELDPPTVCKAIGLCSEGLRGMMPAFNIRPAVVKLVRTSMKTDVKNTPQCLICEFVMSQLDKTLASNATQQEIINAVEQVCTLLPSTVSSVCKELIDTYGPTIIVTLANGLDPKKVCTSLQLCTQDGFASVSKSRRVKDTPQCALCEFVVKTLDDKLSSNATEQEIIDALDQVCSQLPSTLTDACKQLVSQYAPNIISALVARIDPKKVCTFIQLCNSTLPRTSIQRSQNLEVPVQCVLCEFVVSELKGRLSSNATKGEMLKALQQVCAALPPTVNGTCKQFVEAYGPNIIEALLNKFDPKSSCKAVKLCPQSQFMRLKPKDGPLCQMCEVVVQFLDTQLSDNTTKEEVIKTIEQVCNFVPVDEQPKCQSLIQQYGEQLIDQFLEVPADQVCQVLGLCSTSEANKCSMGPVYWCASVENAQKCQPNVKSSALCSLCQEVLAALKISISLNTTQAEVEKFLEDNLCSKLGSLATACNDLITTEGKHIFELLVYGIDPPAICKAIGLCSAVVTDSKPVAVGGQLVKILKTPKVQGSVECTVCEFVADELEKLVGKNSTETEIIAALDKVCSLLPSTISKECEDFVKNYGPAVIALLVREVSPQVVCTALGLCSARVSGKVPVMVAARDSPTCAICEYMMNYMESLLSSNATEEDIKKALEAVCSYLPSSVSTECVSLVEQYADDIVKLLVEELKPSVVCTKLGLCNATSSAVKVSSLKVATPVQCVMCEYMVSQLESMLTKNATEEEIKSALDKVCKLLPATVASECQNVIDKYADEILKLLVKDVKPAAICTAIGLCNATIQLPSVRTSLQCDVCELAMSELEKYLGQKATQAEIMTGLQKVCTLVPSSLKDECSQIISRYGKAILQVLSQDLQPKLICRTLGLCNAVAIKAVKAKTYSCDYCNIFVVNMQSMMRGKPATQRELEDLLLKVCSFIPSNMQSTCSNYVDTYYSVIMKAFLDMKSNQLCSMIELCGQPKGWIRINSMQHSQKAMLGKGSKCMYGPRYWCASLENAKKCQAEQHCRNHVWN